MKPYFYYDGVRELATKLKGNENIYLGIRPYGFHAGNATTLVVYPLFLCKELAKLGKIPHFTFYVFLNDWEQESLDGPDPRLFPFNVLPKFTTWQYMKDPIDNSRYIVDYWEKVIVNNISIIRHYYPKVRIIAQRNSQMKNTPEMKNCIIKTIEDPNIIVNILKENTNKQILDSPISFSSAVCPNCNAARGQTKVSKNVKISHKCNICKKRSEGKYQDFDYWLYHKPLALPRIEVCKINLCITGSDHYEEGDFVVRQKLFDAYKINWPVPLTLYSQTICGNDGNVMGKSKGNAKLIDIDKLMNLILTNLSNSKIVLPDRI